MKKHYLYFLVCLLLVSGMVSCSNYIEELQGEENAQIISPAVIPGSDITLEELRTFTNNYPREEYAWTPREAALHKIVYTAALVTALTPDVFDVNDVYNPIYQTWRVADICMNNMFWFVPPTSGATSSQNLSGSIDYETDDVAVASANGTLPFWAFNYGEHANQVFDYIVYYLCPSEQLYTLDKEQKLAYVLSVLNMFSSYPQIDQITAVQQRDETHAVIDQMLALLEDNPFTYWSVGREGRQYGLRFSRTGELTQDWVSAMDYALPNLLAMDGYLEVYTYLQNLVEKFDYYGRVDSQRILRSLYTAGKLYALWVSLIPDGPDYIQLSPRSLSVPAEGGSFEVKIEKPFPLDYMTWKISTNGNFITLENAVGYNKTDITVNVAPNTSMTARQSEVVVTASLYGQPDRRFTLPVVQEGKKAIAVNTNHLEAPAVGGRFIVYVMPESGVTWSVKTQSYNVTTTRLLNNLVINVSENPYLKEMPARVVLSAIGYGSEHDVVITINQAAAEPYFRFVDDWQLNLKYPGGDQYLRFETNMHYRTEATSGDWYTAPIRDSSQSLPGGLVQIPFYVAPYYCSAGCPHSYFVAREFTVKIYLMKEYNGPVVDTKLFSVTQTCKGYNGGGIVVPIG